ncbi:MAG: hypothetical protein KAZ68_03195 [Candidatus Methylopumilus sp.]|nr:hypothetical protein [Candidatus Methylopumilus sp.]
MKDSILKIAPDPNPFKVDAPCILAQRLNRLVSEGYEVIPHIDCSLVVLKYPTKVKLVPLSIMLLGNGTLATFEGWPYELDRVFVSAGDTVKFDRYIAGIQVAQQSWRSRFTKTKELLVEYSLIGGIGLSLVVAYEFVITRIFN